MRKENKTAKIANMARIQGYHENHGSYDYTHQNYAFAGFKNGFKYYTSDRNYPIVNGVCEKLGKAPTGYGLEVETQCNAIRLPDVLAEVMDKIIFPNFKFPDMWKMQRDGSLGGATSVECITGIMAKSRIRNDYEAWRLFYDTYLPAFGISADSYTTHCGMHVNISLACFGNTKEKQDESIRKLFYIVNKHYNVFRRAFYRDGSKTEWCRQMSYENARTMNLHDMPSDHGNCMNYSHYDVGRIEIRLVGGQKDFDTFQKTMETIFFLVDRVQRLAWKDCDSLDKIFEGVNQYVLARLENIHVANEYIRSHSVQEEL